jgi:hypothetical protein
VVEAAVVEPEVVDGIEMIEVAMSPDENGLVSPLSPAQADAASRVASASARLTGRS